MDDIGHRLQIAYVLVSNDDDIYLEQAYVSMYSARQHNPDAVITVVTDELTERTLVGRRREQMRYADNIIVVKTDDTLNGQRRSRLLKTSLRSHVRGDFLYIDTDTIVVRPLHDITRCTADIAYCHDSHCVDFGRNPYRPMNIAMGRAAGMPVDGEEHYFNSGVAWVRDTEAARRFYAAWHANLLRSQQRGVFMDQTSLNYTNSRLGHVIEPLADEWNVELKHGIRFLKDARIVHYLCTNRGVTGDEQFFIMNDYDVLNSIKQTAVIPDEVRATVSDPFRGLAAVTHCFAGRDVTFFQDEVFTFVRAEYDAPAVFALITRCIHLYKWLRRWKYRLKSAVPPPTSKA